MYSLPSANMPESITVQELLADRNFLDLVAELNKIVSAIGVVIEGNIYFNHSESLEGAQIDPILANYRAGFVEALFGRKSLLEIGFNAGHSALTYLYTNPNGRYVGIDLASRRYELASAEWFKKHYGDRFVLHAGDSTKVLPEIEDQIGQFEAIHVDGGHTFEVAFTDIWNCYRRLSYTGVMIVDDRPAEDVARAIDVSLMTRLLRPLPMDAKHKLGFQAYLEKVPV